MKQESFHEQKLRENNERAIVDALAPGWSDELESIHRQMSGAADTFFERMKDAFHRIAATPQTRLEMAASFLAMPAPIAKRLADDLGPDDVERLLREIEAGVAEIREAAGIALLRAAE